MLLLILIAVVTAADSTNLTALITGDPMFPKTNAADTLTVFGSSDDCKMTQLEACTYSSYHTLCSVTMYFANCEPIFAAASRCDYTSKYYKSKGNCTKSMPLNSPIAKWEGFYDKDAQVMVSTGF